MGHCIAQVVGNGQRLGLIDVHICKSDSISEVSRWLIQHKKQLSLFCSKCSKKVFQIFQYHVESCVNSRLPSSSGK
jgi:hypothetical protein